MPDSNAASDPPPTNLHSDDLWGGSAAMLVALPSSIAFGVAIFTALGPAYVAQGAMAGVLGAIAMGLLAPLTGGTPQLVTSPCAPAAAVMTAFAADVLAGRHGVGHPAQPAEALVFMTLVGLGCGGAQLIYGLLRGGRLMKYIPYPVSSGYLTSVGVLIFLSQMPKFLGLAAGNSLWHGLLSPGAWAGPAVAVGAVTVAVMLAAPKVTKAVPATILALVAGALTYGALALTDPALRHLDHNPFVIGSFTGGAGSFLSDFTARGSALSQLRFAELGGFVVPALTLSILLSMDTLKTCVVVDAMTRTRHDSNRALLGQGLANVASALVGGVPGSATIGATLVNVNSGGATRLSGLAAGALALIAFLVLGRFIAWIPIAALAGILLVVGLRMIDRASLHLLTQRSTVVDFLVVVAVVAISVAYNLIASTAAGFGLAILLFIREQIRGSVIRRKLYGHQISSKQHRLPAQRAVLRERGELTTVCELQGTLFFGTADKLFTELEPDLRRCRYLILDFRRIQSVDFTAAHLLEQIEAMLTERHAHLLFTNIPASLPTGQRLEAYFDQVGLVKPSQNVKILETLDDALEWTEDQFLAEANLLASGEAQPLELAEFDLLHGLDPAELRAALAPCLAAQTFVPGQKIFQNGDPGDELLLIRRGTVRIDLPLGDGKHHHLGTFTRGHFIGDMAFLDRGVRSADATALTSTDLFAISRARFNEVARAHPILAAKLFARLAQALALRVRQVDRELRALQES
ncbi:MAG: cyclic nucleotide-binding domain-containing protein [Verrucomicrobia bacterium]|nr:cyclic nucleotide-binding domain-containing protein [Verrucomicrobiota bacterium]